MKKLLSFLFIVCTVFALLQAEKTVAVATFEVVGDTVKKGEAEVIYYNVKLWEKKFGIKNKKILANIANLYDYIVPSK